jgi:Ca-activated chloride channel homolog
MLQNKLKHMCFNKVLSTRGIGYIIGIVFLLILLPSGIYGQKDAKMVYEGNKKYYDSSYVESTHSYREALKINPGNYKAHYNLGNALYRSANEIRASKQPIFQGKQKVSADSLANLVYDEAAQSFAVVANSVSNRDTLHKVWHNIGNCYLQKKDFDQAITAYKKALKFDPKDEDTRYNLAYALKNRKEQKNGGGGQNQQQQQQQNQDQKNQQQQQQQQQISKEDAERLLKAMMNAEKKNQDKRKQKQEDASKSNPDKDW